MIVWLIVSQLLETSNGNQHCIHLSPRSHVTNVYICMHQVLSVASQLTWRSVFSTCATTLGSPGWLHLVKPCVYFSQTRPKDTPGWYRRRRGEEATGEVVWSDGLSPWFRGCWYRADSPGSVTDSLWMTLHKSLHLKCPHVFRSVKVEISRTHTAGNRYWIWFSCFSLAFPWSFHKQMAEAH